MDEKSGYVKVNFGHAQIGDYVEEVAAEDGRILTKFEPAAELVGAEIIDGRCYPDVKRNSYWVVYRNTTVGDMTEMKELLRQVCNHVREDIFLGPDLKDELRSWYKKTFDR
jgi:hypothetical protein